MHDTAYDIGAKFVAAQSEVPGKIIVEIGSFNFNGSLREACLPQSFYVGVDVQHGSGVDLTIDPRQPLPFRSEFADVVISTSQLEHDPRFWMTFLELCRIVKKGGLIYLNAPSNGHYHGYPRDYWRFYPDAGLALADWATDSGYDVELLESFTARRKADVWNDFVCVFTKGGGARHDFTSLADSVECFNLRRKGSSAFERASEWSEDQLIIQRLSADTARLKSDLITKEAEIAALQDQLCLLRSDLTAATALRVDTGIGTTVSGKRPEFTDAYVPGNALNGTA